jgi:hypothetical protein
MTRQKWTIGAVAAAFSLSVAPMAWAQAGGRPNTSGSSTGSAVSRGGEGGSSGSSSGGSSSGSVGSSGSSSAGSSSGSSYGRSAPRERAPQNPAAVPRGSRSAGSAVGRAPGSSASPGDEAGRIRNRADVPTYSRPRDGRTVTGNAIERAPGVPGGGGGFPIYPPYYPCYNCWGGYWGPGYGYGFGLGYYSWYDPFYYGSWGYGYTAPSYGAGGYSSQYRDLGNLRLKVKPSDAQVYVDGYYVGVIDSFDGVFQKLGIESGAHKIELRAEGYETVSFEVFVTPGETVTYKGEMKAKTP